MKETKDILVAAKEASLALRSISDSGLNTSLSCMADALIECSDKILKANEADIIAARGKMSESMIDRLTLTPSRIRGMADGIRQIIALPTPLGKVISQTTRPNGIVINKVSVPFGVIGIIYESRPNVTSDAAALAIKSGNACVLRGGKEAYTSSKAIVDAMRAGLEKAGVTPDAVNLVEDTSRDSAYELMRAKGFIDLLIPRGGKGLISACVENATVPCLETGTGICHVYVDSSADIDMALSILENAKTSRPSVCNAAEVCLVHKDIAGTILPLIKERLVTKRETNPVELRCDKRALEIISASAACEADFDTEFLDYILAIKVVDSVEEAVSHIRAHSTSHSECIVTSDEASAEYFTSNTDSAAVYVNASTRFTDGGEFGLGCEMGISTQKMHARGPVGINELTTYKYIIKGNGQVR